MSRPAGTVIDLRLPEQRAARPLASSRPVLALSLEAIEDGLHDLTAQAGPFVVVCDQGTRASLAARYLRADGLDADPWRGRLDELE